MEKLQKIYKANNTNEGKYLRTLSTLRFSDFYIYIYTYIPSENNKLLRTYCIINILLTFTYSKPTF